MRDTSDMMEDALSEDTMMDCGGDSGGLEDLVELAGDAVDSSSSIRDAAERLLTMLGVDDDHDYLSSSEDEGVEVDVDEFGDEDEDEDDLPNTKLLHQLAASLAQELKYSRQKSSSVPNCTSIHEERVNFENRHNEVPSIDMEEDEPSNPHSYPSNHSGLIDSSNNSYTSDFLNPVCGKYTADYLHQRSSSISSSSSSKEAPSPGRACLDRCLGLQEFVENAETMSSSEDGQISDSWSAGWDACATETLRYLVEDEGLPPHHPTVLAMKNHLEVQRDRAVVQFAA